MTLAEAQDAVRKAGRALIDGQTSNDAPTLAKAFFGSWVHLLTYYHPLPDGQTSPTALPPDLAAMLTALFDYLASGQIPEPISAVALGSGRRSASPGERKDIKLAVAYVAAVKRGDIKDASPIKTVANAYSVDHRTVQGWSHQYSPSTVPLDPRTGKPNVEDLKKRMMSAGARYKQAGRSAHAVRQRAKG